MSCSEDSSLLVYAVASGEVQQCVAIGTSLALSIAWGPDEDTVLVTTGGKRIKVLHLPSSAVVGALKLPLAVRGVPQRVAIIMWDPYSVGMLLGLADFCVVYLRTASSMVGHAVHGLLLRSDAGLGLGAAGVGGETTEGGLMREGGFLHSSLLYSSIDTSTSKQSVATNLSLLGSLASPEKGVEKGEERQRARAHERERGQPDTGDDAPGVGAQDTQGALMTGGGREGRLTPRVLSVQHPPRLEPPSQGSGSGGDGREAWSAHDILQAPVSKKLHHRDSVERDDMSMSVRRTASEGRMGEAQYGEGGGGHSRFSHTARGGTRRPKMRQDGPGGGGKRERERERDLEREGDSSDSADSSGDQENRVVSALVEIENFYAGLAPEAKGLERERLRMTLRERRSRILAPHMGVAGASGGGSGEEALQRSAGMQAESAYGKGTALRGSTFVAQPLSETRGVGPPSRQLPPLDLSCSTHQSSCAASMSSPAALGPPSPGLSGEMMRKQMQEMERFSAAREHLLQRRIRSPPVRGARVEGNVAERAAASRVDGAADGAVVSGGGGECVPGEHGAAAVGAGADVQVEEADVSLDKAW
jgi:hypothetical protein